MVDMNDIPDYAKPSVQRIIDKQNKPKKKIPWFTIFIVAGCALTTGILIYASI